MTRHDPDAEVGVATPGRITDRETFAALGQSRLRARRGPIRVSYAPTAAVPVQVGYAVGTKVANAVGRNRIRRRLRAVFLDLARRGHPALPAQGALLVGAGPQVASMEWHRLVRLVEEALGELVAEMSNAGDAAAGMSAGGPAGSQSVPMR